VPGRSSPGNQLTAATAWTRAGLLATWRPSSFQRYDMAALVDMIRAEAGD
jgi:hypothetical protein